MKTLIITGFITLLSTFICGLLIIPLLKKIKLGQPILKYVENHKNKKGTPTMGGLFFIIPAIIIYFIFNGFSGKIATVSAVIGLAFLVVGFLDDFIKIKFKHNEGLKPYQKIIFQLVISLLAGVFAYINGLTSFNIPFTKTKLNLGVFTIPVISIIFIAITNSVNLTDGLDGLASSVSVVYLIILTILIYLQMQNSLLTQSNLSEYSSLISLSVILIFAILGFMIFNVNKAKVFMGDTGSLALGGLIGAISVFSSNSFFIPIIGIMFVVSSISVIVQVAYFKKTKKRIFLMAPFHHHLQLKGYTETQISFYYTIITLILGGVCILAVL